MASTFCAIGAQWGEVIEVDDGTRSATSFWAGSVLIDTWRFDPVSEKLRLTVGSCVFDVFVTETGTNGRDSLGGIAHGDAERYAENGVNSTASRHSPSKLGGWDMAAELVSLPRRVEEVQEDSPGIQPEILDEWGNNFLNLKSVTARGAKIPPRMEVVDLIQDTVVHDMVLNVGGVTSEGKDGAHDTGSGRKDTLGGAQMGLHKAAEASMGSFTQGPTVETLGGEGLDLTAGPQVDQIHGKGNGGLRSGRVVGSKALRRCCGASDGDIGRKGDFEGESGREHCASPRVLSREPNQGDTASKQVVAAGLDALGALVEGSSPPMRARPGEGEAGVGPLALLPSSLGRKSRKVGMGFEQVEARAANGEDGPGGARVRRSLAMDDGMVVLLLRSGMEPAVASGDPDDGRQKAGACGQWVGDGTFVGNPRVEITLNGGGLGKRWGGPEGEDCGEVHGPGGSTGVVGPKSDDAGEQTVDLRDDSYEGGGEDVPETPGDNMREAEMQENREAWKLAVESGVVRYDEEDDIMAILQAQNEAIAEKKRLAKQKEKARRSRPKNQKKVSVSVLK
ncbi:hypothetical protein AHAS_Ahas13G0133200 [Arachis hypogaea]